MKEGSQWYPTLPVDWRPEDVFVPEDERGLVRGRLRGQLARDLSCVPHHAQHRALRHCESNMGYVFCYVCITTHGQGFMSFLRCAVTSHWKNSN